MRTDITKELLEELYKTKTQVQIAEHLGVHEKTIRRKFKQYGIQTGQHTSPLFIKKGNKPKLKKKKKIPKYQVKEDFEVVYQELKALPLVAEHYNISVDTALKWKNRHKIPTILQVSDKGKELINLHKPYADKKWFEDMYSKYSLNEIAIICNVNAWTIKNWKKKHNIRGHSVAEQRKKKANSGTKLIFENKIDKKTYLDIYIKEGRVTTKMKNFIISTVGKCQCCGYDEVLDLHHIDGNHYNNAPSNHLVLCPNCHAKIHRLDYSPILMYPENWIDLAEDVSYAVGH